MRTRVVLHVGPARTGTTTLQRRLTEAAAHLRLAGWDYPVRTIGDTAHHQFAALVRAADAVDGDPLGDLRTEWFSEAEEGDLARLPRRDPSMNQILSSEDFATIGPRAAIAVHDWAQRAPLQIIGGVRDPDAWLWSVWSQEAKRPPHPSWAGIIERERKAGDYSAGRAFRSWREAGIDAHLSLLSLEQPAPDLLARFLHVAEVPAEAWPPAGDAGPPDYAAMPPVEAVLTWHLVNDVAARPEVADVPKGFRARFLTRHVDVHRPARTLAEQLTSGGDAREWFGTSTHAALADYCHNWLDDAQELARSESGLDHASRRTLLALVERVRFRIDSGRFRGGIAGTFPDDVDLAHLREQDQWQSLVDEAVQALVHAYASRDEGSAAQPG